MRIKEYHSNFELFIDKDGETRRILESFDGYRDFTTEENLAAFLEMHDLNRDDFTDEEFRELESIINMHSES